MPFYSSFYQFSVLEILFNETCACFNYNYRVVLKQLKDYKTKSQEMHKELQQQLLAVRKECKDIQEQYDAYRDEMSDVQETVELSTLDKEMAEEKVSY